MINSIGVRRDADAVDALSTKLKDTDTDVAAAAAVALGHIGNATATASLRAALATAPTFVRSAVAPEDGSPVELAVGIDAGSDPEWEDGLRRSAEQDRPTVSNFINVAFDELVIGKAFVISVPVHDASGAVSAVVAAPMIDVLLPTELDVSIASEVTWEIGEVETVATSRSASACEGTVELPGVTWQLTVYPSVEAAAALAGTPVGRYA